MDRRFFTALLLTGAVVLLTPLFFPSAPVPPGGVGDSTAVATAPATASPGTAATGAVAPSVPDAPAMIGAASDTLPAPTAVVAEDTITTPKAMLRTSTVGGALVGAELTGYRSLDDSTSNVELARSGEGLLRFRIQAGGDALPLDATVLERDPTVTPANGVAYRGVVRGVPVQVQWSFAPDSYTVKIAGETQPIGYVGRVTVRAQGLPPGGFLLVDLPKGFRSTESDSLSDYQHLAYAYKPVAGSADLVRFGSLDPGERELVRGPLSWAVAKSKYFLVGLLHTGSSDGFAELQAVGQPKNGKLTTNGQATVVVPLVDGAATLETYIGPQEWRRLVAMGREFETANPYGGFMQGVIQPFATIVMRILLWMKDTLELPYGWTLIAFGFLIRIVLWPLNQTAMRSSLKMQMVQPEMAAIQKKYKSDPEKLRTEMMKVYQEHGMSPFSALSGCLPMLIPMPVLFALFFVFQNTIEFRGVEFLWMADISQKDPFYILPVLMAVSMYLLSWIGMRNAPPNPQAKIMLYVLPLMMLFFLFNFAAGLNLYYAAQNLAALPQQWLIANERAKFMKTKGAKPA
jgi:YidC/Oxa1 family membrane protein insertase